LVKMNGTETPEIIPDEEAHVNGDRQKDLENNEYERDRKVNNDDDVVDPEILAAIAASKQDLEEEEVDPAVLAAIEASKREVEHEKSKGEKRGPILMFSTLGKNDNEGDNNDPDDPDEVDTEDIDDKNDAQTTDTPNIPFEMSVEDNDDSPNGTASPQEEEEKGDVDVSNTQPQQAKNQEKLTPTLRRAYITKVKPEKRYCSSEEEDNDGDWGGRKKKKKAPAKKAAVPAAKRAAAAVRETPSAMFKCPNCALTFETIGQLNVHKHSVHGESKPIVLDMGEAVIARLQEKAGSPKDKILKEILTEFADVVEDKNKVGNLLGIALVEGIEYGRLRQGTSGKKNWNNYWLQENTKKRKTMMDKWVKEPESVGDTSTTGGTIAEYIAENSGEFMAIKV